MIRQDGRAWIPLYQSGNSDLWAVESDPDGTEGWATVTLVDGKFRLLGPVYHTDSYEPGEPGLVVIDAYPCFVGEPVPLTADQIRRIDALLATGRPAPEVAGSTREVACAKPIYLQSISDCTALLIGAGKEHAEPAETAMLGAMLFTYIRDWVGGPDKDCTEALVLLVKMAEGVKPRVMP